MARVFSSSSILTPLSEFNKVWMNLNGIVSEQIGFSLAFQRLGGQKKLFQTTCGFVVLLHAIPVEFDSMWFNCSWKLSIIIAIIISVRKAKTLWWGLASGKEKTDNLKEHFCLSWVLHTVAGNTEPRQSREKRFFSSTVEAGSNT